MFPPTADMFEPRTEDDFAAHEQFEEIREGAFIAIVSTIEIVIGNRHIPPITGNVNVTARPFRDALKRKMALEDSRRGTLFITSIGIRQTFKPGAVFRNMGNVHAAVSR